MQNQRIILACGDLIINDYVSIISSSSTRLISFGNGVKIGTSTTISAANEIFIGDFSTTHSNCYFGGDLEIGRFCLISANVYISSIHHIFRNDPYLPIRYQDKNSINKKSEKIIIHDDVWIGWSSVILPGVIIGKGAIIGANSVVNKNVLPFTVVGGSPAKEISRRANFIPKATLNSFLDTDICYFYSGFAPACTPDHGILLNSSKAYIVMSAPVNQKNLILDIWSSDPTEIIIKLLGSSFEFEIDHTSKAIQISLPEFSVNTIDDYFCELISESFSVCIEVPLIENCSVYIKSLHLS